MDLIIEELEAEIQKLRAELESAMEAIDGLQRLVDADRRPKVTPVSTGIMEDCFAPRWTDG